MTDRPYACIFDLDGVLVDTARYHFVTWRRLANSLGFDFDEESNESLKGVSRTRSLELILSWGNIDMSEAEKVRLAAIKNQWYQDEIRSLGPDDALPGARTFIETVKEAGFLVALGSASKNATTILKQIDFLKYFEVIIDGNSVTKSKPDPEVFLKGAEALAVPPSNCVVFEDSIRGLEAAINGGFNTIGVGDPEVLSMADLVIPALKDQRIDIVSEVLTI